MKKDATLKATLEPIKKADKVLVSRQMKLDAPVPCE
jgi:hypothetical protein